MQKSLVRKGLVLGIIILFVGASIIPIISGDDIDSNLTSNKSKYIKKVCTKGDRDQIDQSQLVIENDGQIIRDNIWGAQGIKPTYKIQTRVFLAICKIGNPPNDVTISIRDSLSGPDLTITSIPKDQIPPYPGILWLEANYDDVEVIPQQSYYIVARTTGGDSSNYYLWYGSTGNPYPNGELWYSEDYGYWWGVIWDKDLCFETYGRDNLPPNTPTITGPAEGHYGEPYDYTFITTDMDGDDVYYYIEWGDDTFEDWIGPYESGEEVIRSHTWDEQGEFTLRAKAKDIFDAESDWGTLEVTMPVNQQVTNSLLQMILERFPYAFPILRQLLGL
jgi:hypothetical protein